MGSPRILVADDSPKMRERVENLLRSRFDIVGSVADGQQALDAVRVLNPDILVTDISMPSVDGLEVASRLRDSRSKTKVIFLTVHEDTDFVEAGFAVGAVAYVLKGRIGSDLICAIEAVSQGRTFCSALNNRQPR